MSTTLWTKGPGEVPLYSDWKVSFTISGAEKDLDSGSVSTQSLSDSSVDTNENTANDQAQDESPSDNSEEEQQETFFSVHRNMIGPKSAFFTQSFGDRSESSNVIALPSDIPSHTFASVVEAFELLLDHCYKGKDGFVSERELKTENAVSAFCLVNFFEMDSEISEKVNDFIKSDLTHDTIAQYYQIIKDMRSSIGKPLVLDTKPIMEMVVSMCHESPFVLDSATDLFKIADLSLWLSIGSLLANDDGDEVKPASIETSKVWSENLTSFFDAYKEAEDDHLKDSFRTLTAENILPEVSSKVALRLLEHEHKHGLHILSRQVKKAKEMDDDGLSRATSNISDDGTISSTGDSDIDILVEEAFLGTAAITNLQQRCIKALSESNWAGEENDVEQKRGKLVGITTPYVLEALLIDSVSGERALCTKMKDAQDDLDMQKAGLQQAKELFEFKQEESKFDVAKEKSKVLKIEHELLSKVRECESLTRKLKKLESRAEADKAELCKANALLEAELEEVKKKNYSLSQRFRATETSQIKTESDREMFEMTIKETIKQLDALTTEDESSYGGCGLGHLIMLISAMSDRSECMQIKSMLQQVLKDPQTYERDFLMKAKQDDDNYSFMTMSTGL